MLPVRVKCELALLQSRQPPRPRGEGLHKQRKQSEKDLAWIRSAWSRGPGSSKNAAPHQQNNLDVTKAFNSLQ